MEERKKYFKGLTRRDYIAKANEIIHREGIEAVTFGGSQRRWDAQQRACTGILTAGMNYCIMRN